MAGRRSAGGRPAGTCWAGPLGRRRRTGGKACDAGSPSEADFVGQWATATSSGRTRKSTLYAVQIRGSVAQWEPFVRSEVQDEQKIRPEVRVGWPKRKCREMSGRPASQTIKRRIGGMKRGGDDARAAVVEGWLVRMANDQGCPADPAPKSPFEPHVSVGREQQASRRQRGSLSLGTTRLVGGGLGREQGGRLKATLGAQNSPTTQD